MYETQARTTAKARVEVRVRAQQQWYGVTLRVQEGRRGRNTENKTEKQTTAEKNITRYRNERKHERKKKLKQKTYKNGKT